MRALLLARSASTVAALRAAPRASAAAARPPARAWPPPHCGACEPLTQSGASDTTTASTTTTTTTATSTGTGLDDHHFMGLALAQASAAAAAGEVPVGAVLVDAGGTVLSAAGNAVERESDPTAHAEMLALRSAATAAAGWRLTDATLYVTLEPCAMCAGAALLARVGRIVYGARNAAAGADGSWVGVLPRTDEEDAPPFLAPPPLKPHCSHPDIVVTRGTREAECAAVLVDFFRRRRAENKAGRGAEEA